MTILSIWCNFYMNSALSISQVGLLETRLKSFYRIIKNRNENEIPRSTTMNTTIATFATAAPSALVTQDNSTKINTAGYVIIFLTFSVLIAMIVRLTHDMLKKIRKQQAARAYESSQYVIASLLHTLNQIPTDPAETSKKPGQILEDTIRLAQTTYTDFLIQNTSGQTVRISLDSPLDEVLALKPYCFVPKEQSRWLADVMMAMRAFCRLAIAREADGSPSDNQIDNGIAENQLRRFKSTLSRLMEDPRAKLPDANK